MGNEDLEKKVREALKKEAEKVEPDKDALAKIRDKIKDKKS